MSTSVTINPAHFYSLRRREAHRRFAVKWVFFIFILSLIEGPLRKWFLPGLAGPLTLLRDPFVIALYGYCLNNGLMRLRGVAAPLWLGFATLTSLVGLLQYAEAGFSVWGWTLGVRTYWLYLPLAFVVAKSFTPEDHCCPINFHENSRAVWLGEMGGFGGSPWSDSSKFRRSNKLSCKSLSIC